MRRWCDARGFVSLACEETHGGCLSQTERNQSQFSRHTNVKSLPTPPRLAPGRVIQQGVCVCVSRSHCVQCKHTHKQCILSSSAIELNS